jgi:hypothetical protein
MLVKEGNHCIAVDPGPLARAGGGHRRARSGSTAPSRGRSNAQAVVVERGVEAVSGAPFSW